MNKIIFVADVFAEHHLGGGELNNQELIRQLILKGYNVESKLSASITLPYLEENRKNHFIIANFLGLSVEAIDFLRANCSYLIYEHDHKYLTTRNPGDFPDFVAPKEHVINLEFYQNASAVLCQSSFHSEIARKNTDLDNLLKKLL